MHLCLTKEYLNYSERKVQVQSPLTGSCFWLVFFLNLAKSGHLKIPKISYFVLKKSVFGIFEKKFQKRHILLFCE